jgi:hypothetical protein
MQLFLEEYTSAFFFLTVRCNRSFDTVPFYRRYIWLGIIAMNRYRYYRSILSVMLATDSIDPSVKNFSFLTNSINHQFEKKLFFDRIESSAQDFFSFKDHRSNRCFLQLIDYRYRSNQCFFRHRCPTMVINKFGASPVSTTPTKHALPVLLTPVRNFLPMLITRCSYSLEDFSGVNDSN